MSTRFHFKHPLAYTAVFLIGGVVLNPLEIAVFSVCILFFVFVKFLCLREALIACCSLCLGYCSVTYQLECYKNAQLLIQRSSGIQVSIKSKISTGAKLKITAELRSCFIEGIWCPTDNYLIYWYQKQSNLLQSGSLIAITGADFKVPQEPYFSFQFDGATFALGGKVLGLLDNRKASMYHLLVDSSSWEFKRERIKQNVLNRLSRILEPHAHSLFAGLILGDKSGINLKDKRQFQKAGLMHILSVSGMHLGLIYWLLSWPLKQLSKRNRRLKSLEILLLPIIWIYAFLTGMAPPVFRAAAFISIFIGARVILRRNIRLTDLLASTACLYAIFAPLSVYSVSFQLSFAAMLGIAFWFPLWQESGGLYFKNYRYLGDLMGMSLCCTLCTLPLSLYHFHAIPTWFLVGNLIFTLPFTALIYIFVVLSVSIHLPFNEVSEWIGYTSNFLVSWFYKVLEWGSFLPIPYLYAYDFKFCDGVILSGVIYAWWRRITDISFFQLNNIGLVVLLWLAFGIFRGSSFPSHWEAYSRRELLQYNFQEMGKWAKSQNIDTLYIREVIGVKP